MADHDKDSLKLALFAHDLRTPLGAMRLAGELIGNGPLNDSQKDHLATLITAIDALDALTAGLIEGKVPEPFPAPSSPSIGQLVEESAGLFRVAAEAKGLTLRVSFETGLESLNFPAAENLRRVLNALLDNAVKYTKTGQISVDLVSLDSPSQPGNLSKDEHDHQWVKISIADTGPGIAQSEQAAVFTPFVRGESGTKASRGTGLGLWGAREVVQSLGGHLGLSSSSPEGSRFDIELPIANSTRGGEAGEDGFQGSSWELSPADKALPEKVLIVDDNETNCRLLAAVLESFGIGSDSAASGEQAITCVQQSSYDVILLDLNMPGMSGIETAQALKNGVAKKDIPIVAVTAALETANRDELRAAGFEDVLSKPLSPDALFDVLLRVNQLRARGGA